MELFGAGRRIALVVLLGLAACAPQTETGRTTTTGAGLGALSGAVVGSFSGNAGWGALAGAGVGAAGGYAVGRSREARRDAYWHGYNDAYRR
ncbi:hypothetical protein E0493_09380 [Roseomonas sp. M0104]|uniref:Glycine zipper domain-containing protein n=1 Tax=Teichococcus coralli TaxID=2545983 RepID=A0A845BBP1_9PROT|nr:glycine zipper domain-containing protein [Pseudoroseomonas coralli]MXP63560.1 hypothetical protein [Pseudoroseomonas coralli]